MSHRLAECCCNKEPDNGPPGECSCFDSSFRPMYGFVRLYLIVETFTISGTGSWEKSCYNGQSGQSWYTFSSNLGKDKTIDEDAIHQARSGRLVGLGTDIYVQRSSTVPSECLTTTWQETCSFMYEVETVQQCCTTPPDIIKTWTSPASFRVVPNNPSWGLCSPYYNPPEVHTDVFHAWRQIYTPNPSWNPGCYECCCLKDPIACRDIRNNPTYYQC